MTDRTCSVDGCEKKVAGRGWCAMHYRRWSLYGDVADRTRAPKPPCAVPGCTKVSKTRGWCATHYSRWLRHGTVADPEASPTAVCKVDGCSGVARGYGWCSKHYQRWYKRGDLADPIRMGPVCSVDGCQRVAVARGMCQTHSRRIRLFGSLDVPGSTPSYGTKWCYGCKAYLPLGDFYEGKGSQGRQSPCRACRASRDKQRRKRRTSGTWPDQNRKRRARLRAARSERYTAQEIAERDGWRCQICGRRIGRSYKYPHPRSLSIDHIMPIRFGGDDVKVNVQAAHLRCNVSKGARGVDQLRLIG